MPKLTCAYCTVSTLVILFLVLLSQSVKVEAGRAAHANDIGSQQQQQKRQEEDASRSKGCFNLPLPTLDCDESCPIKPEFIPNDDRFCPSRISEFVSGFMPGFCQYTVAKIAIGRFERDRVELSMQSSYRKEKERAAYCEEIVLHAPWRFWIAYMIDYASTPIHLLLILVYFWRSQVKAQIKYFVIFVSRTLERRKQKKDE